MPSIRSTLLLLALLTAMAPAAAVATPSVTYDRPCVGDGLAIRELGSGFSGNHTIAETRQIGLLDDAGTFIAKGQDAGPGTATEADGTFSRIVAPPSLVDPADQREFVVNTFTDVLDPAAQTTSGYIVSLWGAAATEWRAGKGNPRGTVSLSTIGWSGTSIGDTLYLHWLRGGKEIGSRKVGKVQGMCGALTKRVPQFPTTKVKAGTYLVYLSDAKHLDRQLSAWIRFSVRVSASRATAR